ncbi:MAG: GntR family transcriptional regulator [Candidatus Bipolaricaulota bacterium]
MDRERGERPESALDNLAAYGFRPLASCSIPLYYQLYLVLQRAIRDGRIRPGEQFPSEEAISEHYNVSRPTANRAVEELISRGWLARRRGLGTFVQAAETAELSLLNGSLSFSDEIGAFADHQTRFASRSLVEGPREIAGSLGLEPGESLVYFRRVHAVGERVVMVCDSWLPAERFPGLETTPFVEGSLFRTLDVSYGCPVRLAERRVEAAQVLDAEVAELLLVPPFAPILLMTGTAYDAARIPVECMAAYVKEGVAFRSVIAAPRDGETREANAHRR